MIRIVITLFLISIPLISFGQDDRFVVKESLYLGTHGGTWIPTGKKNKVLGNPPIIGFSADVKSDKNVFGINLDIIGFPQGNTTEPIKIKSGDSIIVQNEYNATQFTFDYGRELAESKRFTLEGMCSIGYGNMTYYNPDTTINIHKDCLIINPGISVRYVFGKRWFLHLKTQYCIANYALKDNMSTDVRGHYLITKLIIGGY